MLLTGAGHQHLPDCKVVATCLAPALPRSRYASRARLHSERSHTSSICGATSSTGHHVQSIEQDPADNQAKCSRLQLLQRGCCLALLPFLSLAPPAQSALSKNEPMEGLKGKDYGKVRQRYPDYVLTESGLQYKDLRDGSGEAAQDGSKVTIDWDGYTIGYYGRPFEGRNKAKGGSFAVDKDLYRFTVGGNTVIPAFEEAILGMKPGGVRRLVVPIELGYPDNDMNKLGPKPSNFSGQRALDFVLRNKGLIDKTLLFDIELIRVGS